MHTHAILGQPPFLRSFADDGFLWTAMHALIDDDRVAKYIPRRTFTNIMRALDDTLPLGCVLAYAVLLSVYEDAPKQQYLQNVLCPDSIRIMDSDYVLHMHAVVESVVRKRRRE